MGAPRLSGLEIPENESSEHKLVRMLADTVKTLEDYASRHRTFNIDDVLTNETLEWWKKYQGVIKRRAASIAAENKAREIANRALREMDPKARVILGLPQHITHNSKVGEPAP